MPRPGSYLDTSQPFVSRPYSETREQFPDADEAIVREYYDERETSRRFEYDEKVKLERGLSAVEDLKEIRHLENIGRQADERIKALAAVILKPDSDDVIEMDVLHILDSIWDLGGDTVFANGLPNKEKAVDYYLGRKVHHVWGTGVIAKMKQFGMRGIRVRLRCYHEGCTRTKTCYARPGCHQGAFCYMYSFAGKYWIDLRNQGYACPTHR